MSDREKAVSASVDEVNELVSELDPEHRPKAFDTTLRIFLRFRLGISSPREWEEISPEDEPWEAFEPPLQAGKLKQR